MRALVSALLAGIATYFVYALAWATTPIPLVITFLVAWIVFWLLVSFASGREIEDIFDTFFLIMLIKAVTGNDD